MQVYYDYLRRVVSRRLFVGATALVTLVLLSTSITFGQGKSADSPTVRGLDAENVIPDQYIVVYKDGVARSRVTNSAESLARQYNATIHHTYSSTINGFAATLNEKAVAALLADPNIAFVEADQIVSINDTQNNATWGLDRIDARDLPLDNSYTYNTSGQGVHAYIIDTGIHSTHTEFTGRFGGGFNTVSTNQTDYEDCNGHGTHVAGTVGGTTYGVAKDTTLYAIRVLDCNGSGTNAGVIAGVEWVTNNHISPAVANMSLGGGLSPALNDAVTNSINVGVTYVVAAGNDDTDACSQSPASVPSALTVGATTSSDARSWFSNFGTCLDIFAPGSDITSAWINSDTSTNTINGTSMASPHVAGAVALYLEANPNATPAQVETAVLTQATENRVSDAETGSPNLLLCTDACPTDGVPPTLAPTNTPTATFTPSPTPTTPSGWACNSITTPLTDAGITLSNLNVSNAQTLSDLDVRIEADHTWVGDLIFTLTHNTTGTSVKLMDRPGYPNSEYGCSVNNVATTFDDASGTPVENVCSSSEPAIGGVLQPDEALSAFNGESYAGDWTLSIEDAQALDFGTLNRWCLVPEFGADPTATNTPAPTATNTPTPTNTPTETLEPTATATAQPTATAEPTATTTTEPTATATAEPTATNTPLPSPTPTQTTVPPVQDDLVIETGTLTNVGNANWTTVTLAESFTSPVVIASASYGEGHVPVVARVQNAVGSQFEVKVERMDNVSDDVNDVEIYYLVVEEGVYNINDHGINLEAIKFDSTVTDRKGSWVGEARSYQNSYTQPVVVGQVMSANDAHPSVFWAAGETRTQAPTASHLRIGKHVGEDSNHSRINETIGYIVLETGSGTLNGDLYVAGVGTDTIRGYDNNPAYVYNIPSVHTLTNAVVSSSGMDGGDGGWPILYGNVAGASSLNLAIDEDQFANSERQHTTEQIAFVAFGQPLQLGDDPMLVQGSVADVDNSQWVNITLPNRYDSMVVVASANYDENSEPLIVRVRNAVGNQFELMVARMDGSTDPIATPVDVYYMVVEEGIYGENEHGAKMEAVTYLSTRTDENNSWKGELRSYQNSYTQPVVVGQVMSANDAEPSQFWARGRSVRNAPNSSTLYVGKHVGEDLNAARADETIGYIVFEAGHAMVNGVDLLAAVGSDTVRGITHDSAPFTYTINGMPQIAGAVVSSAAMDGNNGGWPVLYGATPFADGLRLAIDEDQLADAERAHTTEQVAFVVFSEKVIDSAEYEPSPEAATATNTVAFTGQQTASRSVSNLMTSLTVGDNAFAITEDTAIEGRLQTGSRLFIIAAPNEAGTLEAIFIRVLSNLDSDTMTVGRVTAVSAETVTVEGQSFSIDENTEVDGSIVTGSHVAIIDSYEDDVLNSRMIKRLDSVQRYGTIEALSDTSITINGIAYALDQDSYIIGSLRVGENAYVGIGDNVRTASSGEQTAMIVNSSLVPTAVNLSGQTATSNLTWILAASLIALLGTGLSLRYVNSKRA